MEAEGVLSGVPAHAGLNGAELSVLLFTLDEKDPPTFGTHVDGPTTTGSGSHGRGSREAVPGTPSALVAVTVRSTTSGAAAWVGIGVTLSVLIDAPGGLLPMPLPSPLPAPLSPPVHPIFVAVTTAGCSGTGHGL